MESSCVKKIINVMKSSYVKIKGNRKEITNVKTIANVVESFCVKTMINVMKSS